MTSRSMKRKFKKGEKGGSWWHLLELNELVRGVQRPAPQQLFQWREKITEEERGKCMSKGLLAVWEVYVLCFLKHSVLRPLILFCGTFIFAGRMTLAQQVNPVYQVQLKCLKLMSKQWILKNSKCQVHYRLYVVGTLIIAICLGLIKSLTCKDWSKKL